VEAPRQKQIKPILNNLLPTTTTTTIPIPTRIQRTTTHNAPPKPTERRGTKELNQPKKEATLQRTREKPAETTTVPATATKSGRQTMGPTRRIRTNTIRRKGESNHQRNPETTRLDYGFVADVNKPLWYNKLTYLSLMPPWYYFSRPTQLAFHDLSSN
jgi:hypothetical protein